MQTLPLFEVSLFEAATSRPWPCRGPLENDDRGHLPLSIGLIDKVATASGRGQSCQGSPLGLGGLTVSTRDRVNNLDHLVTVNDSSPAAKATPQMAR